MADTYTIIRGNNIKLIDNEDGTYSLSTSQSGTLTANVAVTSSALPTGAATSALQTDGNTLLTAIKNTDGIKKIVDALPAGTNNIGKVDVNSSALPTGAATSAKQDTLIAKDFATQTTLASLLAQADIKISVLRDALLGVNSKTLSDLETLLTAIKDTGGIKKITDTVNVLQTGSGSMSSGIVNVTTAGTRVQLSDIACREVIIIAKRTNTGYIYVGGNTVSSTSYGAELAAKDSITIPVNNVNKIYIDSSVSGEGISYVAV